MVRWYSDGTHVCRIAKSAKRAFPPTSDWALVRSSRYLAAYTRYCSSSAVSRSKVFCGWTSLDTVFLGGLTSSWFDAAAAGSRALGRRLGCWVERRTLRRNWDSKSGHALPLPLLLPDSRRSCCLTVSREMVVIAGCGLAWVVQEFEKYGSALDEKIRESRGVLRRIDFFAVWLI